MKRFFNKYVQEIETYIMFRIKEKTNQLTPELKARGRAPISLSMGAPTAEPPKFVIEALKDAMSEPDIHTYTTPKGEPFFLDAVVKRMKTRFGVDVNPKTEVFSLIGSKEGIANLIRAIIQPKLEDTEKDIILVPDPAYASYKEMIKVSGGYGYSVPLTIENNFMPNLDEVLTNLEKEGFDKKKVKAILINYPSNPLGASATRDYYEHVVDFCKRNDILLISDAAYVDMYFDKTKIPMSVLEIEGAKDIAVEFFTFSKPYAMTGWRCGWVCGNAEVISYLGKLKSTIDTGIFKAIQLAASKILNSQEGEEYIEWANHDFKKKCEYFTTALKEELGWEIPNIPNATFYQWLPIPPRYNNEATKFADDMLEKSGIVIVPGEGFGTYGKGFFRASIVCSDENLHEIIRRMKEDGFYYN